MIIQRLYTREGQDLLTGVRLGKTVAEGVQDYTVPQHWGGAAIDILTGKIFYRGALPALTRAVPEDGVPEWLWRQEADGRGLEDVSAEWRYRYETDIRDVLHRIAGSFTYQGWKAGLFGDEAAARVFYDELRYMLLHRIASFEIAIWARAGLDWAYGIRNESFAPAAHIPAVDILQKDVLGWIKLAAGRQRLEKDAPMLTATLPVDNIDSPSFITLKKQDEMDAVTKDMGQKALKNAVYRVMDACDRDDAVYGFDPDHNAALRHAIREAKDMGASDAVVRMAVHYALQGYEEIDFLERTGKEDDVLSSLTTVLSVPDDFIETAMTGHGFMLSEAGEKKRHISAEKLMDTLVDAVWSSGAPHILFQDAADAQGYGVSGGGVFLQDTAAPAAMVDLLKLSGAGIVDIDKVLHVTKIMLTALECSFAGADVSARTRQYRPLCLGAANLAPALMGQGIAYDSDAGRTTAALITALLSGAAYHVSAEMALRLGPCGDPDFTRAQLQHVKDKISTLNGTAWMKKGMMRRPLQIKPALCPDPALGTAVSALWEKAYALGSGAGFRHGHLTAMWSDADVKTILGAQTESISPGTGLVRFEGYFSSAGDSSELYGKKLNPVVPGALHKLGYSIRQIQDIHVHALGCGTLEGAPFVNHETLRKKGFHQAALDALESALKTAQHIRYAFNKWTLGEDFCQRMLGFATEDINDDAFDMLSALGFSEKEINAANAYCCGALTLERAPHIRPEHLTVFDCQRERGARKIAPEAEIRMRAAVEPFLSGLAGHVAELAHNSTIDDVRALILLAWELGAKGVSVYRDGCSLLYPSAAPLSKPAITKEEERKITHAA